MKRGAILLLALIILSISFTSANFALGNKSHSINTSYSPSDTIKGWINISLTDEPANSLFETSQGDSISLLDLINLNPSYEKECNSADCESAYSEVSGSEATQKSFNLEKEEEIIIGLKFIGDFGSMTDNSFNMKVESNAGESDKHQLEIDVLSDGLNEWESYKESKTFSSRKYGCFELEESDTDSLISGSKLCNEISITESPRVIVGANIINNVDPPQESDFELSVETKDGSLSYAKSGACQDSQEGTGIVSCMPEGFQAEEDQDILACIRGIGQESTHKIKYETNNPCWELSGNNQFDFNLFVQTAKFAPVGSFYLNNTEVNNAGVYSGVGNIESQINDYIDKKYKNNCEEGCIVPIKFKAVSSQDITISDVFYEYTTDEVIGVQSDKIYDINGSSVTLSSDYQRLNLDDANFSVSDEFGNSTFSLDYKGSELFSEEIIVERIPMVKSLNPMTAIGGYPTEFTVSIDKQGSNENITSYSWDFGDGSTSTTQTNIVSHTYESLIEFPLKITITDSAGHISSKIFNVSVKSPKDALDTVLSEKRNNLNNINSQIQQMELFQQNSVSNAINLTNIENQLSQIQQRNASASSDEDYVSIMSDLIRITVPKSIIATKDVSRLSLPKKEIIGADIVSEITGETYDSSLEDQYIEAILAWNINNANLRINHKELSAEYNGEAEEIVNVFDLVLSENQNRGNSYLMLPVLDDINFKQDYSRENKSGYYYMPISSDSQTISFSTTEDLEFNELPVFLSPRLDSLQIFTGPSEEEEGLSKWFVFIAIMAALLFGAFLVYIILQEWYKRRYENYLFSDRNDLYNIVSYIQTSKKKGMSNQEIASNLRKTGWSGEQVSYVMKKYSGKKTGMIIEIPVDKIINFFQRNNQQKNPQRKPPKRY